MNTQKFIKKKKHLIIISVSILTITIATILTIAVIGNISKKPTKDLIKAVDIAWSAGKAEDQPTYLSRLDEQSFYELNKVEKEDNIYVIEATITAPDLGGQLSKLDSSDLPKSENKEEINVFLCEQIKKSNIKRSTAEVYAYKINGEYHITFSDEFADAMSGNLYKYSQNTYLEILQKYVEGELK